MIETVLRFLNFVVNIPVSPSLMLNNKTKNNIGLVDNVLPLVFSDKSVFIPVSQVSLAAVNFS